MPTRSMRAVALCTALTGFAALAQQPTPALRPNEKPALFGPPTATLPDAPPQRANSGISNSAAGVRLAGRSGLDAVVREIGPRPAALAAAPQASDLPLAIALRQLVPAEFELRFGAGVPELHRVSWPPGDSWLARLAAVLNASSLRATVAWDAREVLVQVVPRADAEQVRPWTIVAGDQTVRRGLTRWLNAAGVALAWEAPGPVPVRADWSHDGTLDEALAALARDLAATEQPLCLRRYNNGVVRVTTNDRCPAELAPRDPLSVEGVVGARPAPASAPAKSRPADVMPIDKGA